MPIYIFKSPRGSQPVNCNDEIDALSRFRTPDTEQIEFAPTGKIIWERQQSVKQSVPLVDSGLMLHKLVNWATGARVVLWNLQEDLSNQGTNNDLCDARLREVEALLKEIPPYDPPEFKLGDMVRKVKGSAWQGKIVGTYSTELTKEGFCIESEAHFGSVQIYPASALEKV